MSGFKVIQLDFGNTHLKCREGVGGNYSEVRRWKYQETPFRELVQKGVVSDQIQVSAVAASEVLNRLMVEWRQQGQENIHVAKVLETFRGLTVSYDDISRLGVDRWLAMLAGYLKTRNAICVVDFGTAITVDFVDSKGVHLGGYIIPGQRLMVEGLLSGTSGIHLDVSDWSGTDAPGRSTRSCVLNGCQFVVDGIVQALERKCQVLGIENIYLTGGGIPNINFDSRITVNRDLLFEGLSLSSEAC